MKRDRDSTGKFTQGDRNSDRNTLEVTFPRFNTILIWIGLILILLPWILIILRNELFQKTLSSLDKLMTPVMTPSTSTGNCPSDSEGDNGDNRYWK